MFSLIRNRLSPSTHTSAVIILSGPNKVGVISELTSQVAAVEGNIGRAKMTKMFSDFSIMASVQVQNDKYEDLVNRIKSSFEPNDFFVGIRKSDSNIVNHRFGMKKEDGTPIAFRTVHLLGPDSVGILHKVTEYAASVGMDVISLSSSIRTGSHIGYDIFEAKMTVSINREIVPDVDSELHKLGDSMGLEITIKDDYLNQFD